jgi:hypothetical protein
MQKSISASIIAVVVASMILATALSLTPMTVEAKKPAEKCNNVKIQVRVTNAVNGTEYTATATLDGKTVSKTVTAEEDGTLAIPLNFKKLSPCPVVGDTFSGDVNGTAFSGEIKSLKKPNKVSVTL